VACSRVNFTCYVEE